jgi:transcription termination factor Rho
LRKSYLSKFQFQLQVLQLQLRQLNLARPAELLGIAKELGIENVSSSCKQDMVFAIVKRLAESEVLISGDDASTHRQTEQPSTPSLMFQFLKCIRGEAKGWFAVALCGIALNIIAARAAFGLAAMLPWVQSGLVLVKAVLPLVGS